MVVVDIDIIHGDHLVRPNLELSADSTNQFSNTLAQLAQKYPAAEAITLRSIGERVAIEVKTSQTTQLLNATNGEPLAHIDAKAAKELARFYYAGSGEIVTTTLIESAPPGEIGARALPLWRVDFDDLWGSTLYISPTSGALATKRHTLWRVFDFLWMLHIMDYDERENVNNWILRIVSFLAFLLVITGIWYLYFRLNMTSWFSKARP